MLAKRKLTDNANDDSEPPFKKTRPSRQGDEYHAGVSHSIVGGNSNSNFMALGNHNSQVIVQGNGPVSWYPPISRPPIHPRLEREVSSNAFYNSWQRADPPKCHPNTRLAILRTIREWIRGNHGNKKLVSVMWLHGPAGSGKTAIAQTIAEEILKSQGPGLASYFFGRLDATRNHPGSLIATIVYQMAPCLPDICRDAIYRVINNDPLIFRRDLAAQIKSLIVDPLQPLIDSGFFVYQGSKRVVIIDGLDECVDPQKRVQILQAISSTFQKHHFPLLFLICSRPEADIVHQFDTGFLREISKRFALDRDYMAKADISIFLWEKLKEIKTTHHFHHLIPPDWPTKNAMRFLVEKSSGQFIYASTVIKFLKPPRVNPCKQLEKILELTPLTGDQPFAELDAIYRHVFESAEKPEMVMQILSLQLLSLSPMITLGSIENIEDILCLSPGTVEETLCDLVSIVDVTDRFLRLHHASLPDFLFDRDRSGKFHLDPPIEHAKLAYTFLQYFRNLRESRFDRKSSMSYWPRMPFEPFSLKVLAHHIRHASPNEDLEKAISDFDFTRFYGFAFPSEIVWSIPIYLESIKHSKLDNAMRLYTSQREAFYRYIRSQEKLYYSNPYLLLLFISVQSSDMNIFVYECAKMFSGRQEIDTLRLSNLLEKRDSDSYRDALMKVLQHPISDQHYASAALCYLKIIKHQYAASPRLPIAKGFELISGSLRDTPWKYSSKARRLKVAVTRKEQRIEDTSLSMSRLRSSYWRSLHEYLPVDRRLLSFLLKRAHWSKELIDYALHFTFNLNWVESDVHDMMILKRTIDCYLTRMATLQDAKKLSHNPQGGLSDATEPIVYRPELELYLPGTGVALPEVDMDSILLPAPNYGPFPRRFAGQDLRSPPGLCRIWYRLKGDAAKRFGTKWIYKKKLVYPTKKIELSLDNYDQDY